ncbi:MAG: hypothetical protein GW938_01135 [Leptospira sp.]|nr:hypothetical protein [Leptospira sp.]NCS92562.1 hypothetical protein [Leptospira sp.]
MRKKIGTIFIPGLEALLDSKIPHEDKVLDEIKTWADEESIPMLSPVSSYLLASLVRWLGVSSFLELGTGAGYSLLGLGIRSIRPLTIATVDRNFDQSEKVETFWNQTEMNHKHEITFYRMNILDGMRAKEYFPEDYEMIFVDCDKITYPNLLDELLEKSRTERSVIKYLLFDNVLWHGRILDQEANKPSDKAMQIFWKKIEEINLTKTILPSGDGMLLIEL